MKIIVLTVSILCVLLSAARVQAVPVSASETTLGDFGLAFTPVGTVDVGLNTVTGSVSPGDTTDTFRLVLPAGLTITAGEVVITNYDLCVGGCNHPELSLPGDITEPVNVLTAFDSGNGTYPLTLNLPFSIPGGGNVDVTLSAPVGFDGDLTCPLFTCIALVDGKFDYVLKYTVEGSGTAVPEPSTLVLMASGALVLAIRRKAR